MSKVTASWIIAISWFLITFVLFIIPGSAFPSDDWFDQLHLDKLVHIFIFAGLVIFFSVAWRLSHNASFNKSGILLLTLLASAYGIGIEFIQKNFVANRGFEWMDWMADLAGVVAGAVVVIILQRRVKKH